MSLTPPLGAAGIYKLKAPYNTLLRENITYRCAEIRRFNGIVNDGGDVFEEHYKPYGVGVVDYQRDAQANEAIISLVSDMDHWVFVPTSYIESYPNQGGIPYQGLVLGVPLGPVPTWMNLAAVRQKIKDVIHDTLGIDVDPQYVQVTELEYLSQGDHDRLEQARSAKMNDGTTDNARYLKEKTRADALAIQVQNLEEYIRANQP